MRVRRDVGVLRREVVLRAVVARLRRASDAFRVLHYSVQSDHLHLIVEASSAHALARKMTGLATWLARRVNGVLGRRGPFFADRYHRRDLRTPREVRNALVYVLHNGHKHARQRGERLVGPDVYSSAPWFEAGFPAEAASGLADARQQAQRRLRLARGSPCPLPAPETWLARNGWRRAPGGLLALDELPVVSLRR